ncbi:Carnitine O-acetyltransferase, mitochondrial [Nakaseomyces bracarensis]|uniref:Carnitine O-acetyltransferase, mitochondrial n=1 Tax=Nakaseomyces bracarensis TaxID=273131 RepID=A0ABR4NQ80_9SACH
MSRVSRIAIRRFMSSLKRFPFETKNGEVYWAAYPNSSYQNKRQNFKGETFALQDQLPSLPVPELEKSIATYLQSVKPYVNDLSAQEDLCNDFLKGMGPVLQKRLQDLGGTTRNWMSEFWDNQAYLQYNDPVVPYVSYFYSHKKLPAELAKIDKDPLLKATAIISTIIRFIESIKDESLPAEVIKGTPFCMNSFQLMFNNSRIPETTQDSNVFYSIYENNFMIVTYRGNFYKVFTHFKQTDMDENSKVDAINNALPVNLIWQQLYNIVNGPLSKNATSINAGVGSLTSLPRDQWREVHAELIKDPLAKESLETIHRASFVLCLDLDKSPITLEEKARNCWHGDGFNRFFDKPLQFFVTGNGTSGCLSEHSKMDGTPTLFLNTFVCQQLSKIDQDKFINSVFEPVRETDYHQPKLLPFVVTPKIAESIDSALTQFRDEIGQHDLRVWHYNRYGKEFMKKNGMSPDAFIQQVIQLAIYKYLGRQVPTYEAASTRKYFKGRTETGRPVSEASAHFVKTWESTKATNAERIAALKESAKFHGQYMKMASEGQAPDRHFFGLKNMLKEGDDVPALFNDSIFKYSSTWYVSTSQLSSEYFDGYGWSEVNDNGLGLAYMINKDWMHINIVTKPEKSMLSVDKMHHYLNEAADEIADVLLADTTIKAKL